MLEIEEIKLHRNEVKYRIQKRVGYFLSVGAFLIALLNLINLLHYIKLPFKDALLDPSVSILFIIIILAFISTLKDYNLFKLIQVLLFFGSGVVVVLLNDPGDLTGVAFFVYAIILALQYDFMRKHLMLKIIGLLIIFFGVIVFSASLRADYVPVDGMPTIVFTIAYLYIIWIAFAEEIKEYISVAVKLKQDIAKNQVFVDFGKNVSGIVHNLKNKMMAIDGFIRLIEKTERKEIKEYVTSHKQTSKEIRELINSLMFTVSSRQKIANRVVSLRKIVRGTVDLFNADEEFKKKIITSLNMNLQDEALIFASPLEVSQVLENIISNSWEAMEQAEGHKLNIDLERCGEYLKLKINDQGYGISFCSGCSKKKNCLECGEFQIGRSSKKEGFGMGMVFIQKVLKKMKCKLMIDSKLNIGTTVEIHFPLDTMELPESVNPG